MYFNSKNTSQNVINVVLDFSKKFEMIILILPLKTSFYNYFRLRDCVYVVYFFKFKSGIREKSISFDLE